MSALHTFMNSIPGQFLVGCLTVVGIKLSNELGKDMFRNKKPRKYTSNQKKNN